MRKAFHITFNEATQLATRPTKPRNYKKSLLFWFNVWLATRKIRKAAIVKESNTYPKPRLSSEAMTAALAMHFQELGFTVLNYDSFYQVRWGNR